MDPVAITLYSWHTTTRLLELPVHFMDVLMRSLPLDLMLADRFRYFLSQQQAQHVSITP